VGFDDIAPASRPPYSLTTVHQDYKAIGAEAARLLIGKIHDSQKWKPRQVLVPTQLIIRSSSGPRKKIK
jgi:DNA-binding LacI/PurR family transcriptional regulator